MAKRKANKSGPAKKITETFIEKGIEKNAAKVMLKNEKKLAAKACLEDTRVHPALKAYFGYCLYKSGLRLRALLNDRLAQFNMVSPQFAILGVLHASGAQSQISLGNEMGIDKATMVKFIDSLEKSSFVKRVAHSNDRRVNMVELTASGQALFQRVLAFRNEIEDEFLAPLSANERKVLKSAIPKLLKAGPEF